MRDSCALASSWERLGGLGEVSVCDVRIRAGRSAGATDATRRCRDTIDRGKKRAACCSPLAHVRGTEVGARRAAASRAAAPPGGPPCWPRRAAAPTSRRSPAPASRAPPRCGGDTPPPRPARRARRRMVRFRHGSAAPRGQRRVSTPGQLPRRQRGGFVSSQGASRAPAGAGLWQRAVAVPVLVLRPHGSPLGGPRALLLCRPPRRARSRGGSQSELGRGGTLLQARRGRRERRGSRNFHGGAAPLPRRRRRRCR